MKYIVTDPCYLVDDRATWLEFCDIFSDDPECGEKFLKAKLKLNLLEIADTGYGDWSNSIHGTGAVKIINEDFYADAGLVCVTEYTEEMERNNVSGAIFETDGVRSIAFSGSSEWTEVTIYCIDGTIYTEEGYCEDDEDDWSNYEEDEE